MDAAAAAEDAQVLRLTLEGLGRPERVRGERDRVPGHARGERILRGCCVAQAIKPACNLSQFVVRVQKREKELGCLSSKEKQKLYSRIAFFFYLRPCL
jgi:hypothetical protein